MCVCGGGGGTRKKKPKKKKKKKKRAIKPLLTQSPGGHAADAHD